MGWRSVEFWQGRWPGYGVAILSIALAMMGRQALSPLIGSQLPFLLFFPAIVASAGIGGTGAGLLALALASLSAWAAPSSAAPHFPLQYLCFVLAAAGIILLSALFTRWRARALLSENSARENDQAAAQLARELELLIDGAINQAIYMLDRQGRVTIWNKGAERIKGWSESEVIGQHCSIFYPPDELAAGKPAHDLARATREGKLEEESWRVRRDGTEFLASVTITRLDDENGAHIGFGKVIRDVTEQRATEGVIESREAQLVSILATVPDGMVVIDDTGVITSFSAAAERMFGWTEDEVIGRKIETLMPEPDRGRHDGYIARYHSTGERRIIGTTRRVVGRRKNGEVFPLELSIGETRTGGQRLFTGFLRDLTAREEGEARMRAMQDELTHVSRLSAMGTMASTLAHEINQPIAAVANYVEASRDLIDSQNPETLPLVREALVEAASEAFRAGSIVRRLRAFVARGEVEKRVEDLQALVDEAAILGLAGATEQGVDCEIAVSATAGAVLVDKVQIQQVLVNLMRNAVEAMGALGPGGRLTVAAEGEDANVHVIVRDTGPGLSPTVADRLFEAFATTKREGMGLGLSICRTIIEAHGGRIWATPGAARGTEFHFTLPKASTEGKDGR